MGKTRQTQKRNRQSKVLNLRNRAFKTHLKNTLKSYKEAEAPDKKAEALRNALSALDKAGQRHLMHPRTAARKKSVLAREMNLFLKEHTTAPEAQS
ncbi:MAG: 30S ribosomal protein S20 [candidate division Zixibacteria bacterium]|nr:30S ribosomal protein S20 [candidate division Zixibacteria bacterium]